MHIARQSAYVAPRALRSWSLSCQALPSIAAALDVGALLTASVEAHFFYRYYATSNFAWPDGAVGIGLMSAVLFVLLARIVGLYRLEALLTPVHHLARVMSVLAGSLLAVIFILFLLKIATDYSRGAMIVFAALALVTAPASRVIVAAASRYGIRQGVIRGRRVVTLGDVIELERLGASDFLQFEIEEIARFGLDGASSNGGLSEKDRARIAQAIEASRQLHAVEFALIMPWSRDRELLEVCNLLRVSPLPVRLHADHKIRNVLRQRRDRGFARHFSVTIQRGPLSARERALKRALDMAIAVAGLVVLAPLLLVTSLVIKLDSPGPVIFRQRRCGFDNREFVIFKFRTMTALEDGGSIVQAKPGDERVTRVGRMLRRTSIDELPQLFNVVRGDMSLVGPRPHAIAHDEEYKARINNYALRHHVKPGVTGAAQVMGLRGETRRLAQMEQRVERDLWYINNWSLTLDLKIMAMTCVALLRLDAY
ncbi:MAG: exopolysaccharide biosynthesis polyprenyl glycosylphosphotransferase [Roseiarcus sp.]|jgi:undecaprenyl-phosphate galactose phosphotransferase/putative colanic acid biosynthesis UDP-glucose lipid carrier transferase